MKTILFILLVCIPFASNAQIKEFTRTIYFNNNEHTLTHNAKQVLDSLKTDIAGRLIINYSIKGYTDNIGTHFSNEVLSHYRARAVETWLRKNIENGETLFSKSTIEALGEDEPLNANSTEEQRIINRRVQLVITADYTPSISISKLSASTNTTPQTFCIDNKKDSLIICQKGTMVYIKAHSFKKIVPHQCVLIKVRESFSTFDALTNDLTTYNDKNILYSESMVEVAFEQNGKKIELTPQRDYIVFSPSIENISNASLYNGTATENQINWEVTKTELTQIKASQLSNCNTQSFGNNTSFEFCHKRPFFFYGLGKLMTAPLKSNGIAQWKSYNQCRKSHKYINQPGTVNYNFDADYANAMSNLQVRKLMTECIDKSGNCMFLFNKLDLQCNMNWQKKVQQSIDSMLKNGDQLTADKIGSLQYVVFNRNNLGWSNIDWMLKVPENKRKDIYVNLEDTKFTEAKIIFKNFKTILKATADNNGNLYFPQMPVNEPASIILLDTRTGTEKLLAEKLDIITNSQTIQPNFNSFTTAQYIKLLEGFK